MAAAACPALQLQQQQARCWVPRLLLLAVAAVAAMQQQQEELRMMMVMMRVGQGVQQQQRALLPPTALLQHWQQGESCWLTLCVQSAIDCRGCCQHLSRCLVPPACVAGVAPQQPCQRALQDSRC